MAIETLRPSVGILNSLPASEDKSVDRTPAIATGIPEHILPYAERAAEVGYLSKLYLLPYMIGNKHSEFLRKAGFAPSEAKKRGVSAKKFIDSIQRGEKGITQELTAEEYDLSQQYRRGVESIQADRVGEVDLYAHPDARINIASHFIANLLNYPQDRRLEILEAMGFSNHDARQIGIKLAKAFTGTVIMNTIDGPILNSISIVLGQFLGNDIANKVSQQDLLLKVGVVTAAVASVAIFHGSNYIKANRMGRAVGSGIHGLPNVAVVATAMAHQQMKHPEEHSDESNWELFCASIDPRKSPQAIIDEFFWWGSWLVMDYGITFSIGNLAGAGSNLAQIAYMEALMQYVKYTKHLEESHKQGFQLENSDIVQAQYLLEEVFSQREETMMHYPLQQPNSDATSDIYSLDFEAISANPLYSLKK